MGKIEDKIEDINSKLKNGQREEAYELLSRYLPNLKEKNDFNPIRWTISWRRAIYELGKEIAKINYQDFIESLEIWRDQQDGRKEKEPYDFVISEIYANIDAWNSDQKVCYFQELIEKYPMNPEFWHDKGIYIRGENSIIEAIECLKRAYEIEKGNTMFQLDWANMVKHYIDSLLQTKNYQEAHKYAEEICKNKGISEELKNIFVLILDRIKDAERIDKQLASSKTEVENYAKGIIQKSQFKTIEILSIFTAIIAVVFSTITIAQNYTFHEALALFVSLALLLLVFLCVVHLLFAEHSRSVIMLMTIVVLLSMLFVIVTII